MKKVIITGANGFIGRQCLPLLVEKGFEVHGISSTSSQCEIPNVEMHKLDLMDGLQVNELMKKLASFPFAPFCLGYDARNLLEFS